MVKNAYYYLLFILVFPTQSSADQYCRKPDFKIYDATAYKIKSSFLNAGIEPIKVLYVHSFWDDLNNKESLPDKNKVVRLARKLRPENRFVVIDIEHWELLENNKINFANLKKYKTIIGWMKQERPDLLFGYYATLPLRDYHRSLKDDHSPDKMQWFRQNSQLKELTEEVDMLFPSLYTVRDDPELWKRMAIANLKEATRIAEGKPVVAFLWPQFHQGNKKRSGQYLSESYWSLQLETVYSYADSIIIWGGWEDGPAEWDEDAEWWQATKSFLKKSNTKCETQSQ